MKRFKELISSIENTTSTSVKIQLLSDYFLSESEELDKLWAIALFIGKRPPRTINTSQLRAWCAEHANIPLWLFEQNYHIVGDLAETIALIVTGNMEEENKSLHHWIHEIQQLKKADESVKKEFIFRAWKSLDASSIWVLNKIITGGFRIGISKNIIIKSLSLATSLNANTIAYLLTGDWSPINTTWQQLFDFENKASDLSKPYPFYLAHALDDGNDGLINTDEWLAEWKWDGIRSQLILRGGQLYLWSRGEELITENFPEFHTLASQEMEYVLDGEIIPWSENKPMGFQSLQTRIAKKNPGKKLLSQVPVVFMAYDIMESGRVDIRTQPFENRRKTLEKLLSQLAVSNILLSPLVPFEDLFGLRYIRNKAKDVGAEGLMLKKKSGVYHTGRKSGDMWKWKVDPYTIDAVMIYAQRGHGRRANLFSDFTFALRDGDRLVPFAKAYSGLSDTEMSEITAFVRSHTVETFGPVASVQPELVFELAFEGISLSTRHKSGISVRFPRISRWRKDKKADEINTLDDIRQLAGML